MTDTVRQACDTGLLLRVQSTTLPAANNVFGNIRVALRNFAA